MSIKLKTVTENSWIVIGTEFVDGRGGVLMEVKDGIVYSGNGKKMKFKDRDEACGYFGEKIFNNIITDVKKSVVTEVNGFPVKPNSEAYAANVKGARLPLFVKREGSSVYYAAGYYAVKTTSGWLPVLCPKLSTLDTSTFKGPFMTDADAKKAALNSTEG